MLRPGFSRDVAGSCGEVGIGDMVIANQRAGSTRCQLTRWPYFNFNLRFVCKFNVLSLICWIYKTY
jgi:hypothetical protein